MMEELQKALPDVLISINSLEDWINDIYPYIKNNNYKELLIWHKLQKAN